MTILTRLNLPRTLSLIPQAPKALAVIPKDRLSHLKETKLDLAIYELMAGYKTDYLQKYHITKTQNGKIMPEEKTSDTFAQAEKATPPSLASKVIRHLPYPHEAAFFIYIAHTLALGAGFL
jgi:hypothetical protein